MIPEIFGFEDSSYLLMMFLGIIAAFVVACLYFKKINYSKENIIDLLICSSFAVALGIVFAVLFENLYEIGQGHGFVFKLTFFGGLAGGVLGFILTYIIGRKFLSFRFSHVLNIAPGCVALAHAIGRIGCFLSGCCYGKETNAWYGVTFYGDSVKRIPTQLFEAIFLFVLASLLIYLAFKKHYKYSFAIYILSYCLFRFLIEFIRDDNRGRFFGIFSPSQVWCIVLFLITIPLIFIARKVRIEEINNEQE